MLDVLRGYLQVANGLSDVAVQRAREVAESLTSQGMEVTSKSQEQVQVLTDEILETSRTNRDLLTGLIRTEVDRAVGRMGFVREEELAAVRKHVQRLEDQLRKEQQKATDRATGAVLTAADVSRSAAAAAGSTVSGTASKVRGLVSSDAGEQTADRAAAAATKAAETAESAARTAPAKKAATKSPAKKAPTKKTTPATTAKKSTAPKAAAKKTTAKKTSTTKSTAAKPTATKSTAKKSSSSRTSK